MAFETTEISNLANRVVEGDRRAIGQAISLYENGSRSTEARYLSERLWPYTNGSITVGVTGPPGVGKSTLASGLVEYLREQDMTVGVVAVDPSSPLTNGALLGDRIRMNEHATDRDVFIRSMSSRGHLGGAAESTFFAMMVLDAAGKDVTLVETVGVGQSEVEIKFLVDTVTVVMQPGSGDSIQAIKSGLMEIPDVLCLNKADRPEAAAAKRVLRTIIHEEDNSNAPVFVETDALNRQGLDRLWQAIEAHRDSLGQEGLQERRRTNLSHQLAMMAMSRLLSSVKDRLEDKTRPDLLGELQAKTLDPLRAVDLILKR